MLILKKKIHEKLVCQFDDKEEIQNLNFVLKIRKKKILALIMKK